MRVDRLGQRRSDGHPRVEDPYGSWKMICMRRRILRSGPDFSDARSIPSNLTVPEV